MKTKYAVLSSLFFIIQLVGVLPLRAEHYYFKQISLKEGLPSNVRCILRDEQGFVWIGTKSGLGKFDGHELKRYKHQANDPNSLLHNLIYQIAEDKQHNIWVLTEKGIARYQQQSNDFTFPTDEDGKNITAYSFCLVPDGILFGGKDRIYKYSYDDSSLRLLQYFNANSFKINALSMWDSKTLLCCSRWTGIYLVDLHTGEHRRPPFDCGPEITTMMTDSRKRIWIAPYSGGLRCYSYDGKLLASYSTRNSALSNDIVLSLAEREGQLWIGTDGGGINILTPETGEISQLEYIPGRENYSLPANSILCLHNDHNNNIWAGSTCNGLISIREVFMKTYTDVVPGNDRGLSNSTVRSLYRQSTDSIWIGTDGGGINLFNPRTEKFTHYLSTWNDKIAFISGFTPGKLLISLFSKGVFVFNPATGEKQPFTIVDKETTTQLCNRGKSVNLYQNTPQHRVITGRPCLPVSPERKEIRQGHRRRREKYCRHARPLQAREQPDLHQRFQTYLRTARWGFLAANNLRMLSGYRNQFGVTRRARRFLDRKQFRPYPLQPRFPKADAHPYQPVYRSQHGAMRPEGQSMDRCG